MTIEIFELDLLCSSAASSRTTRVGVEQELIVRDVRTGGTVAPERLRSTLADNAYLEHVSFEPGGQLELSLPAGRVRRGGGCRAPGRGRLRPPGRSRVGHRAPRRRRGPSHRGPAPPEFVALRRDGEALRLDRSGRPGDDAADRLDPGLPGLVAGRRGARAVPGAAARRTVARRRLCTQHRPGLAARDLAGGRPGPHGVRRPAPRRRPGRRPTSGSRAAPSGSPSRT